MNYLMMLLYARLKPRCPAPYSLTLTRGASKEVEGKYDPQSRTFTVGIPPHADRDFLDTYSPLLVRWIEDSRNPPPRP